MVKIGRYIGVCLLAMSLWAFVSCSSDAENLQKKQQKAEQQTAVLCDALIRNTSLDSIRLIAEKDPEVLFYIFDSRQMVYWSSNRLASDEVYLNAYDTWRDMTFSNAQTKARWTKAGIYNVLTVLPLQYTEFEDFTDIETIASQTFSFRRLYEDKSKPYSLSRLYFILCHVLGYPHRNNRLDSQSRHS